MIEQFILGILTLSYILIVYLKSRELRKLSEPPSKTYLKLATDEQIKKTRLYNRDKLFMDIFEFTLSLVRDLYMVRTRSLQHSYTHVAGKWYSDALFMMMYFNLMRIVELPFEAFSVFYIEAKHQFNNTTPVTFIMDFLKMTLVILVVASPFAFFAIKIIKRYYETSFYIYLWVFMSVFQIGLVIVYPTVIQPWFNKFEEMENSDLKTRIQKLAKEVGFTAKKILVVDASKRSGHSNAYFTGITNEKRVVLYDTLFKQLDSEEILAVLCHEFGHWKHSHTIKMISMHLSVQLLYLYLFNVSLNPKIFGGRLFTGDTPLVVKILYFMMAAGPFDIPIGIIRNSMSRYYERQADRFAVSLGYGKELISGLIKLHEKNSSNMDPDSWYSTVVHTHPTVIERIKLIEDEMSKIK